MVAGVVGMTGMGLAQGTGAKPVAPAAAAPVAAPTGPPLQLRSLDSVTQADPFPAVNQKNFTADSPSVATVDSYLHAMLGYDANRIWRVVGIQKTAVAGVSKVTTLISEKGPKAKVLTAMFYVMPDGKHLIAPDPSGLSIFGANPFAENRAVLQARANGPAHGGTSKDLLLVEFADLQCPHCKDAQATMAKLAADFPKARIVYENFPLTEIHPFALQAAEYGDCVAKQSNPAFFTYAQAVYDTQAGLTAEAGVQTLNAAVTKAGMDPAVIAACAATDAAKADVNASTKLAIDLEVNQTPMLSINGRMVPVNGVPYDVLKSLIVFQASLDGVSDAAAPAAGLSLKPRQ